ncbi:MAG: tRNA lysidine(34) synthetase TilS, partial [Spirochaetaceae bacterium]|nr:tRNA lysidine(34) synthetase TilS [Spirochaetaceae bacterium]
MIGAPPLEAQVVHSLHGLPPDAAIIAAVSGGADSTALLAALAALRDRGAGYALHCAHVNHNLRGEESLADARAVEQLCKDFDIPCHIETIAEGRIEKRARETGSGIEAAAREARRRALRRTALRCHADAILIAHTKNDLLE